ncbi:hypothetical protein GAY31_13775 [Azospirillum brasilense]|nr:hypothetical protein [Azospirillum brasilense]
MSFRHLQSFKLFGRGFFDMPPKINPQPPAGTAGHGAGSPAGWAAAQPAAASTPRVTSAQIGAAIGSLSQADVLRIERFGRLLCRGLTLEWLDLFHETVLKTLTGKRTWANGTPFLTHVLGTMRSLASAARKDPNLAANGGPEAASDATQIIDSAPSDARSARDALDDVRLLFEDDPEAWNVLVLSAAGHSAAEVAERLGLTSDAVRAAHRRARRLIQKAFPEGLVP